MDLGIGAEPQHQSDNQTYEHLADELIGRPQAVLALLDDLDVVVEKTQQAQPQCRADHEQQVDVAHTTQQEHGHEYGDGDDDAAHGGHAFLLFAVGVDRRITRCLADVSAAHVLDELLAEPCRDDERQNQRQQGTEGNIAPYVSPGDIVLL